METIIPVGLLILIIGGLITVNKQLAKHPTYHDTEKRYKKIEVCDEIHKNITEKLECLPDIKRSVTQIETKIDIFLEKNGKK